METVQVAFGMANGEIWGSLRRQHPEKKPENVRVKTEAGENFSNTK